MNGSAEGLGKNNAAFGLSAAVVALFNTVLACVKDAYHPLNSFMNSVAGHNWTTQALADIVLFALLGMLFSGTGISAKLAPRVLISLLMAAVILAGTGLFAWYSLY